MRVVLITGLLATALSLPCAGTDGSNDLAAGVAQFRAASQAWSLAGMQEAAATLARACEAERASARTHSWAGTAYFYMVLLHFGDDSKASRRAADAALANALTVLERASKLDPADAETHALLSTIHGMRIAARPATAIWRGPKSVKHRKLALASGSRSPRVCYLIGMSYLFAPEFVGGASEGLKLLLEGERLYGEEAQQARPALTPSWGYDHCLAFIGQAYERQGDVVKAEVYYRASLAKNPEHNLAKEGLERCLAQE